MPAFVDHYQVLGVAPSASEAEIRRAFRRVVHRHHADRNPQDAAAGERMRAILTARDLLCDRQQRARFDLARAGRGAPEVPVDPLFQAAARAWGQAPPPNPPAPPPAQVYGWGAAVVAGAAGLAAALGLSLLAAAGVARSVKTRGQR
ncbi:J domain-containing protein [Nannocystis sp. ILAH1]|uniref:J domain-containing protein n=1 Tax=Nannocystis sp. ILAH1 TaxID=2996789 RepID=UPI002270DF19|nr:J domain-containing protein [Nannocystis sp. ILAH1]MCY0986195.1 J domain-containing protein [Nannocystis sp. ILAH1]